LLKQRHQVFVALLFLIDALVILVACFAAWVIRRETVETFYPLWPRNWESFVKGPFVLFALPITLYCLWMFRLYRPRRDQSVVKEIGAVFRAALTATAAILIVMWAIGDEFVDGGKGKAVAQVFGHQVGAARLQLGALAVLLPTLLSLERWSFRMTLRVMRRHGMNLRHVAVIGAGRLGQITVRTLERNSWTGISIAYFLSHHDHTERKTCLGRPVLGGLTDLERVLEERRVDAVYLAIPTSRASVLPTVLHRLERFALDVRIIPDVPPRYMSQSMTVSELEGMPILSYRESPLNGLGGFTKRMLDLAGATTAITLLSPIMLAAAVAVKLSGPGPVVFRQRRVSLGGEKFNIYKFRSMVHVRDELQTVPGARDAEHGSERGGEHGATTASTPHAADQVPGWTKRNDRRVTRVGRFIRRTSIDELPQLFNVLRGDMSLVGPRPERPELIERFREDWRGYMLRQHVKAGITGWAQVNGLRGQTSLRKRLQYDLFYIRHWSLLFDLRILWLTAFRGWMHPNAH